MARVSLGTSHPLGATRTASGVNFAVRAPCATRVELCLFDGPQAACERERIELHHSGGVWHRHVAAAEAGQCYGFRVSGPYAPREGHRHNPQKLLMDPQARMLCGPTSWHPSQQGALAGDLGPDPQDSAVAMLRSVVCDERFDWQRDRKPAVPWADAVIYECHVKGMTMRHPEVPLEERGTYLGMCSEPVITHLRSLGVTTVSLMPVHEHYSGRRLCEAGLTDYWGYSTLGYFAPSARFATASGRELREFKMMVRTLHRAGIEVVIDVVYNHTAESDEHGATLSLRGLDNRGYYRLDESGGYTNYSGCGNTLDARSPMCRELWLGSLRYWAEEMHVDGFRFDLAPALNRGAHGFEPAGGILAAMAADPALAAVKRIAEPWDLGPDGYCVGRFPRGTREWNDRFRDDVRRYFRGDGGARAQLASRLAGSSDIFDRDGKESTSSINFVTCHDGFTLRDLVSYAAKHNDANGEDGRDGTGQNLSANWGVEGDTDDERVLSVRARIVRGMLLTLACSQGVPMISHGDELGRTQRGNNNGYCHDSELTWIDWSDAAQSATLAFARAAFAARRAHPLLRCSHFLHGSRVSGTCLVDLAWVRADGEAMTVADWDDPRGHALGMQLVGHRRGELEAMLVLFNGGDAPVEFRLPVLAAWSSDASAVDEGLRWRLVLHTESSGARRDLLADGSVYLPAHTVALLESLR